MEDGVFLKRRLDPCLRRAGTPDDEIRGQASQGQVFESWLRR